MSATEKISVTIGRTELAHAKRLASRLGLSLSGFITDAVRERVRDQERREAALEVLSGFSRRDRATPDEAQALLKRWTSPTPATRRPKHRARTKGSLKG